MDCTILENPGVTHQTVQCSAAFLGFYETNSVVYHINFIYKLQSGLIYMKLANRADMRTS